MLCEPGKPGKFGGKSGIMVFALRGTSPYQTGKPEKHHLQKIPAGRGYVTAPMRVAIFGEEIKLDAKFYENCAACLGWCHKMTPGKDVFCAGFLGLNPTGLFLSAFLKRNFKVMMAGANCRLVTVKLTKLES